MPFKNAVLTYVCQISESKHAVMDWGIDIVGPLPIAKAQVKFAVIVVDYFTKWVEAEPLATITEKKMESFVEKNILSRFGVHRVLVSDNGR